jgi:hypothetical protein
VRSQGIIVGQNSPPKHNGSLCCFCFEVLEILLMMLISLLEELK